MDFLWEKDVSDLPVVLDEFEPPDRDQRYVIKRCENRDCPLVRKFLDQDVFHDSDFFRYKNKNGKNGKMTVLNKIMTTVQTQKISLICIDSVTKKVVGLNVLFVSHSTMFDFLKRKGYYKYLREDEFYGNFLTSRCLYVQKDHRQNGIGMRLIEATKIILDKLHLSRYVSRFNESGYKVAEKCGLKKIRDNRRHSYVLAIEKN